MTVDRPPASLTVVCQVRFPPILSLLEEAGVAGFQEALRRSYPVTAVDHQVAFAVDAAQRQAPQIKQQAPVWRLQTEDERWTVSTAVDFIALETPHYPEWGEFRERLQFLLAAADRTLAPARSVRIGLRKINVMRHPEVARPRDWGKFLRSEVLPLGGSELPGVIRSCITELNLNDDRDGTLTIRLGPDPEDLAKYRVDLDYWTERKFRVMPDEMLMNQLEAYSKSMTSFFHWSLRPEMYKHLDPRPRPDRSQR
jgi:uncharacterized protein (TIGR04255 family)